MVSVQSWPIASKVKDSAARTMSSSKKMERSLHHARSGHRLERSAEDAAREASRLNSRPAAETYRCKWLIANFSRFREDFAKSPAAFLLNYLVKLWRQMFDIRAGEHVRTWAMFWYLFSVLMAYYIVKPVSRSMFLTKFDVDKLPSLYIVIAVAGGMFAYLYSRLAAKTSLHTAVFWTMLLSVISLCAMWGFIYVPWMIYVLNIWVSLFSIVLVSQGWLVAGNVFNAREAKRLYRLLGMSMVLGAASGGEFTNRVVRLVGTRNLRLACAAIVVVAYGAFRVAVSHSATSVEHAHAGSEEETDFSFFGIVRDLTRVRHLQVIVGLMVAMYIVDTFWSSTTPVCRRARVQGRPAYRVLWTVLRVVSQRTRSCVRVVPDGGCRAPFRRRIHASDRARLRRALIDCDGPRAGRVVR